MYAELVPSKEIHVAEHIWYLPHHAVFNPNKPDKLRVVFDCASRYAGKSLNEHCLQGPDLVNKLLFVLLQFHIHGYSVQVDIGAMYSQVSISPHDHDALGSCLVSMDYRISSHFQLKIEMNDEV